MPAPRGRGRRVDVPRVVPDHRPKQIGILYLVTSHQQRHDPADHEEPERGWRILAIHLREQPRCLSATLPRHRPRLPDVEELGDDLTVQRRDEPARVTRPTAEAMSPDLGCSLSSTSAERDRSDAFIDLGERLDTRDCIQARWGITGTLLGRHTAIPCSSCLFSYPCRSLLFISTTGREGGAACRVITSAEGLPATDRVIHRPPP